MMWTGAWFLGIVQTLIVFAFIGGAVWWKLHADRLVEIEKAKQRDLEDQIVKLYDEASDKQLRRLDPPQLETAIPVTVIFHREKRERRTYQYSDHEGDQTWFTRWELVNGYTLRRNRSDPAQNGPVYITDEYKTKTILFRYAAIMRDADIVAQLPPVSLVATRSA